jgi:predicted dehydrogenase
VLAPGAIAHDWVTTVHANTDQRVRAVASRSAERAARFSEAHSIERHYDSYEALVADDGIDIVYVAAPHSEHRRLALLAITAGKHVLIEKPIAHRASDAQEIADAARRAGVFAMEAMWSRFLPQTSIIAALLEDGALGDLRFAAADFGATFRFDPASRAFDPALGGGALLDIGVYALWFAHFALGAPERITASGTLASTGVDAQASVILEHAGGAQSVASASLLVDTPTTASVSGTAARIELGARFYAPGSFRLVSADGGRELRYTDPTPLRRREALCYQATAVAAHIAEGRTEAPEHPLATSVAVLRVIDEARRQLGAA